MTERLFRKMKKEQPLRASHLESEMNKRENESFSQHKMNSLSESDYMSLERQLQQICKRQSIPGPPFILLMSHRSNKVLPEL